MSSSWTRNALLNPEYGLKSQSLRIVFLIVLLAAAVIIGHSLPGLNATQIDSEIRDTLHFIGFALIAAVIFEALPMRITKAALTTLVLVTALGVLAELAQKLGGKGIDLTDLLLDIAGATIYLSARIVWQWTNAERRSPVVHFSAQLVSIVLGVLIFVPLGYWLSFQFLTMRAAIVGGYGSKVIVHISDGLHPGYRTQHRIGDRSVSQLPTILRLLLRGVVDIPGRPDFDPSIISDIYIIGKTKRKDKSEETRLFLDDIRLE